MGLRCEALNVVIGARAVSPLVRVRPQAELELQAATRGLFADEAQHFEIAVALGVVKRHRADLVTRNVQQIWVGEVQIVSGDTAGKVVSQTQSEAEAIEAVRDQR